MPDDIVTIGNHGLITIWVQLSKLKPTVLQGNIVFELDKLISTIVERDGVKFGVIGLHGKFAFRHSLCRDAQEPGRGDEIVYLQKYLDELKPQVDVTVLLVQFGGVRRALDKDIPKQVKAWILPRARRYHGTKVNTVVLPMPTVSTLASWCSTS